MLVTPGRGEGGNGDRKRFPEKVTLELTTEQRKDQPVRREGRSKCWVSVVGGFLEDLRTFL